MSEATIKQKLADALQEPGAGAALVARTVTRARALTEGREAERLLAQQSGPGPETAALTAKALVGRLMLTNEPPDGVTPEQMTAQLLADPRFAGMEKAEPARILNELKSGALIRSFAPEEPTRSPHPEDPQRKAPLLEKPTPFKGGPAL